MKKFFRDYSVVSILLAIIDTAAFFIWGIKVFICFVIVSTILNHLYERYFLKHEYLVIVNTRESGEDYCYDFIYRTNNDLSKEMGNILHLLHLEGISQQTILDMAIFTNSDRPKNAPYFFHWTNENGLRFQNVDDELVTKTKLVTNSSLPE